MILDSDCHFDIMVAQLFLALFCRRCRTGLGENEDACGSHWVVVFNILVVLEVPMTIY